MRGFLSNFRLIRLSVKQLNYCPLRQIFSQAQESEYIYKNPAASIQLPKQERKRKRKRALTSDEITLFTTNPDLSADEKMFVFLILYCGLRRGEALALTVNDIDMDNKKIYVNKNLIFKGERFRD